MPEIIPGFSEKLEQQHAKEKDHIFGATNKLPQEVLVEDGDWRSFYPKLEVQRNKYFDTYSCVSWANCNVLEMMHKKRYDEEIDLSDRFMSVVSNTKPGVGNSHVNVAECRRTRGGVLEEVYPFTQDMRQAEFFQAIPSEIRLKGKEWIVEYKYGYEKVRRSNFKEALKFSPIQIAVDSRTNKTASFRGADHSIVLTCIDENDIPHVYDSYLNRYETYDKDYPFSYGLRVHYKQNIILKLENMELKLVKGDKEPEVYLVDFAGIKHHIDSPTCLTELFSEKAWENIITTPQAEVDAMPEDSAISVKGVGLLEALKTLIQAFGNKKGKK